MAVGNLTRHRRSYIPGEAAAAGLALPPDFDFLCLFAFIEPAGDAAAIGLVPAAGLAAVSAAGLAPAFAFFLQR